MPEKKNTSTESEAEDNDADGFHEKVSPPSPPPSSTISKVIAPLAKNSKKRGKTRISASIIPDRAKEEEKGLKHA